MPVQMEKLLIPVMTKEPLFQIIFGFKKLLTEYTISN